MLADYRDFKEEVLTWLANYGKNPKKGEGLAESTLKSTHYKLETVFRWLWDYEGRYTTELTPAEANRFVNLLNMSDGMIDSSFFIIRKSSSDSLTTTTTSTGRIMSGTQTLTLAKLMVRSETICDEGRSRNSTMPLSNTAQSRATIAPR